jgi:glucose/arabinose dehydrogenase
MLTIFGLTPSVFAQDYSLEEVFPSLTFDQPVEMTYSPANTNLIFIVSQKGFIEVFDKSAANPQKQIFLDIQTQVEDGGERGLLGMTFHPNYAQNGYFYLNYTQDITGLETVIARFSVNANNPFSANPNSKLELIKFSQPFNNHNAGKLSFGGDGFLYIATGDGGSGGDPQNNAQNRGNLLGKILRINVDQGENGNPYAIPADNPFKGNSSNFREEIYAYGLRNPWKFSFDSETGQAWIADVGQNEVEEINLLENGGNYGWKILEGTTCYSPSTGCNSAGTILPIFEYNHDNGDRSITGGFVYRSNLVSELYGKYIYADYVSRRIWALEYDNGTASNELLMTAPSNVAAFGQDADGEIYVLMLTSNSKLLRLKDETVITSNPSEAFLPQVKLYPNPTGRYFQLEWINPKEDKVEVSLYSTLGEKLKEWKHLLNVNQNSQRHRYSLEGVSTGNYYIEIKQGELVRRERLILE